MTPRPCAEGTISPEEAANVATTLMARARLAEGRHPDGSIKRVVIYIPANNREKTTAVNPEPVLPEGVMASMLTPDLSPDRIAGPRAGPLARSIAG